MAEYVLFGNTVSFDEAAERYYAMQQLAEQAKNKASNRFNTWYNQQNSIENVLDKYEAYTIDIIQ